MSRAFPSRKRFFFERVFSFPSRSFTQAARILIHGFLEPQSARRRGAHSATPSRRSLPRLDLLVHPFEPRVRVVERLHVARVLRHGRVRQRPPLRNCRVHVASRTSRPWRCDPRSCSVLRMPTQAPAYADLAPTARRQCTVATAAANRGLGRRHQTITRSPSLQLLRPRDRAIHRGLDGGRARRRVDAFLANGDSPVLVATFDVAAGAHRPTSPRRQLRAPNDVAAALSLGARRARQDAAGHPLRLGGGASPPAGLEARAPICWARSWMRCLDWFALRRLGLRRAAPSKSRLGLGSAPSKSRVPPR